ncbi:cytochrome P450 [Chelativorans salis]|uniref:Cytochrome P450 n=1 Tax=Chelativorans salis TaxID=2978478 RepID=A0ABT2LLU5_9HYPH|nr:cytochrome P450 [Chelativorans sp. EGI FJ00035]MCT7375561.1 cytochrome P450 [Chelativorans sp. EGI FJ00035]
MVAVKYYEGVLKGQKEQRPPTELPPFDMERLRTRGVWARLAERLLEDPRWALALLRRFWPMPRFGKFLLVTRNADVREVLERQDVFQTPYGPEMTEIAGGQNFILGMHDGPQYRHMKSTILSAFPIDEVEQVVRPLAARHAEEIMRRASPDFDVVDKLLKVVPVRICRDYFGMRIDDEKQFSDWANALSGLFFADPFANPIARELAVVAADRMKRTIDLSIEAVRGGTTSRLTPLGRLVDLLDDTSSDLGIGDVHSIMMGMIAGFAPTNLLAGSNCLDVVLSRNEARKAIEEAVAAKDDTRLERVILEAMRFKPIWIGPFRYTARDAVIAKGTRRERAVKAGTAVMPAMLSAMFDPDAVANPNVFDIERPARDYLVFGHGIHQCIGAAIARVQIAECFRAIFSKPGVRRAKGRAGRLSRLGAYPESLRIVFEPSPLSKTVEHSMVSVVFACDDGTEAEKLREEVGKLGNPANEPAAVALDASGIIHFASLAVVCAPSAPANGERTHLVLELSGDGADEAVVQAFAEHAGSLVRGLLEDRCGLDAEEPLEDFMRARMIRISPTFGSNVGLVFSGTPGHSVARIRAEAELESAVRGIVANAQGDGAGAVLAEVREKLTQGDCYRWALEPAQSLLEMPKGSAWAAFKRTIRSPRLLVTAAIVLLMCWGITYSLVFGYVPGVFRNLLVAGTSLVLALVGVSMSLAFVGLLLHIALRRLEKRDVPSDTQPDPETLAEIVRRENHFPQNNLTAVSVMKPGMLRRLTLRLSFYLISITARNVFRPGFLADINTIHFARWVLLPGTDRLVFFSNYGGSWESYLEDFIAKARAGLTGVWSNTQGFPRTRSLFFEGARDGARFKRWARAQQIPTLFWYSAYPGLNTNRIRINALIRSGIAKAETESEARDWLRLFGSQPRPHDALETEEIQTVFFGPLGPLQHAHMTAVSIPEGLARGKRKAWLRFVEERTSFGNGLPVKRAMTVMFGPNGLARLGLDDHTRESGLETFPAVFRQGMATEPRSRILDDVGRSAPACWEWGSAEKPVDAVVICYAADEETLTEDVREFHACTEEAGMTIVTQLPLVINRQGKQAVEHFGFADGISQPVVLGTRRANAPVPSMHLVAPGEFLLGYKDESGFYPLTPTVPSSRDRCGVLPAVESEHQPLFGATAQLRDFGRNGSFVVVRQIEQHVETFHAYCKKAARTARSQTGNSAINARWISAKMVGRWPDGTSLVRNPNGRKARKPDNDFSYATEDPQGLRCPFGSHVRRSNPRDSLGNDKETQIKLNNRHRILRCGRSYERGSEKGLLFMCFNADIERQYEFMQQSWVSAATFHGLLAEKDPTIGASGGEGRFTIPSSDGSLVLTGLPEFVTTRGGGYFFMPSRSSLRYLLSQL